MFVAARTPVSTAPRMRCAHRAANCARAESHAVFIAARRSRPAAHDACAVTASTSLSASETCTHFTACSTRPAIRWGPAPRLSPGPLVMFVAARGVRRHTRSRLAGSPHAPCQ